MFSELDISARREQYRDQLRQAESARLVKQATLGRPAAGILAALRSLTAGGAGALTRPPGGSSRPGRGFRQFFAGAWPRSTGRQGSSSSTTPSFPRAS